MKKININVEGGIYDIFVTQDFKNELKSICQNKKIIIVSNDTIAPLYMDKIRSLLDNEICEVILKDGEQYKNQASVEQILDVAFSNHLDRKSVFIALGGGVVGDITGYASGIFMRGAPFVQIPTTLLAQVDASVGGKTGINNAFGKNLVGLFHQPQAVFIDISMLDSLPTREFGAGVAEIIKMAVCFDGEFFSWLENNSLDTPSNLKYAIERSINIKAKVVNEDEKEQGIRAGLNYGHTFGHVIENLTSYTTYLHGEAVAIGIQMANELAYIKGNISISQKDRIKSLLERYNLPTTYKISDVEEFYSHFLLDKKAINGAIKFILPIGIGDLEIIDNIDKDKIIKALSIFKN